MHYWQKFSRHFTIKVALSHLLLGVVAATFSLSDVNSLLIRSGEANIVPIASVMVNLQEHQSDTDIQSQLPSTINNAPIFVPVNLLSLSEYTEPFFIIRLTPNNGIRAGPSFFIV